PKMTCWMALGSGATATAPLLALLPSDFTASIALMWAAQIQRDALPLLREVVAWDRTTRETFRLRYVNGKWEAQPLAELKGERLRNGFGVDMDSDGMIGEYFLQTDTDKLAQLRVNRENRLQLDALLPSTPAHIRQLIGSSALSTHPISAGGVPPTTILRTVTPLPDLDGDGKPEKLFAGDSATGKPSSLVLSRTQRAIKLPVQGINLVEQIELTQLDGDAALELVILRKRGFQAVQIQTYDVASDGLKPLSMPMQVTAQVSSPSWIRDLDGDGMAEIVIADTPGNQSRTVRWTVFQAQNGQFREIARYDQRLPLAVQIGPGNLSLHRGLAVEGIHTPSLPILTGGSNVRTTVLVGFPEGRDALNPAKWQFAFLRDASPSWAGDYDGDGVDELIAGGTWDSHLYLLQFRDGVWRGARLGEGGIGSVLPVRVKGKPWLVLLSTEGQVELLRVRSADDSNATSR
ncbi:MAG: hypothetical protein N2651_01735, partial [Fimbriimonadales bacterium]|nr:hypothetical protein [Fimbriimonadales bacterium]